MPTREEAWNLLTQYTKSDSLQKHALAVEGVMRHFAKIYGGKVDEWGLVGLVHDLDYEMYPDQHCQKTEDILRGENWPDHLIRAVLSHGYGMVTDIKPQSDMEKVLYTIDELTGLLTAAAYMRPSKSVVDLTVKSAKKKFKSNSFAAGVDRQVILTGCDMLGKDLDWVLEETIQGMRAIAPSLGM